MDKLSLAYQDFVTFPENKDFKSIDLLSSQVGKVSLDNYPNLLRIRISKCHKLQKVIISNMPKLQVVDLLDNSNLKAVLFVNCPSLVTLEAGYNPSLETLEGIPNLKYLSAPSSPYIKLKNLPNAIFLDLSSMPNLNIPKILQDSPNLECLVCKVNGTLNLSDITKNHSLKILQIQSARLNCDSIDTGSNLKIIIFDNCQNYQSCITGNQKLLDNFYVTDSFNANQIHLDSQILNPKYQLFQKMLYGPWGVPDVDLRDPEKIDHPVIHPPKEIDHEKASDAIVGSIMLSAIFDMIGVGVEFINKPVSQALLLGNANISWSHPRCNRHNERFVRGTPTDDTSQSILIMRTIVDANKGSQKVGLSKSSLKPIIINNVRIDPCDFGEKLIDWIHHGHSEHKHKGGLGCGSTTYSVVSHSKFKTNPILAAYEVWEKSGRKVAPNGSVMRIASSGCFAFWDDEIVVNHAKLYAQVTHADPRCIYSSVAAALIIARYIRYHAGIGGDKEPNIDEILSYAKSFVEEIEDYESDIDFYSNCKSVDDLNLSEHGKIGYTLKAFGSAVWALRYCSSIEEGIDKVIREGGDSDTNGAVVGALLGAKFGFKKIPFELVEKMFVGQWIFREMDPYMKLMGMKLPDSPYI